MTTDTSTPAARQVTPLGKAGAFIDNGSRYAQLAATAADAGETDKAHAHAAVASAYALLGQAQAAYAAAGTDSLRHTDERAARYSM